MKKILPLFLFFSFLTSFSQKKYSKEFSFTSDNDLYTSLFRDGYYTNGMFASYRYLSNLSSKNKPKTIYEIQIGHHMYTPFKATVNDTRQHDRPFAAYLFGSFGVHSFYNTNTILKLSSQIGIVGPSAGGEELMDVIHDIYNFKTADGWKYQIKNTFALNFSAEYIDLLKINKTNSIDISWYNKVNLGTIFTDLSTGFYTRIGLKPLQKLINSIAFNSNLNNKKSTFNNKKEIFLFLKPTLSYVIYDATIQGSLFSNESPITFGINPFKFSTELGIRFTANRFNFGYAVFFHTKKLKSNLIRTENLYGTLQFNYQFN